MAYLTFDRLSKEYGATALNEQLQKSFSLNESFGKATAFDKKYFSHIEERTLLT